MAEPLPDIMTWVDHVTPASAANLNGWADQVRDRTQALLDAAETAVVDAQAWAESGNPGPQGDPGPVGPAGPSGGARTGLETNAIFNGDLALARLGMSVAPLTHLARTFDRFIYGQQGSGSVLRWDVDTDVPDATVPYSSKFTVTTGAAISAGEEKHVRYAIEGSDFLAFRGKRATLSFWVKTSTPGTYSVAFTNGSRERTYVTEYTIAAAGVWQEIILHPSFEDTSGSGWDYGTGQGIGIRWAMTAGSTYRGALGWNSANVTSSANQTNLGATTGNYFKLAKIQMSVGDEQLPYFRRAAEETLRLCSRYLQVFRDADFRRTPLSAVTTAAVTEISVPLSDELRALPTVTLRGTRGTDWMLRTPSDSESTSGTLVTSPAYGRRAGLIRFEGGTFTAGTQYCVLLGTASARIVFDAEL